MGAGPSGAIAASLLRQQGHQVIVIEKQHFPRFSIGESLLPCCMQFLEQAGMLEAVNQAGFQFKNGAAFRHQGRYTTFDFNDKFTPGPS
ncbi:tryptophan 7-halogenase, partial [Psychrobacter sp. CAL606-MNA-CIBAN-0158]|uniref:NAD(P)/FAD-dependent oxidoreductase n=1 Tax=Psychrobacter sp. CAL606-MNA-CIBAN-0158 TaxID=3140461 RepID=UPI0033304F65